MLLGNLNNLVEIGIFRKFLENAWMHCNIVCIRNGYGVKWIDRTIDKAVTNIIFYLFKRYRNLDDVKTIETILTKFITELCKINEFQPKTKPYHAFLGKVCQSIVRRTFNGVKPPILKFDDREIEFLKRKPSK